MKILDINELLQAHPYPGRGIVLGRSADGQKAVIIYVIMGRSGNSRNRVFEATGERETVILNKHGEQAHAASKVPN